MKGRVIVLSGPSGAGKSTLIKGVRERVDNLSYSTSHTTRKPRSAEKEGADYFFTDKAAFQEMINRNEFVEWARVYDDFYGTSYQAIDDKISAGEDIILDIDVQGAKNIKEQLDNCLLIFILPPSMEILEKRLRGRATDSGDAIENRIRQANSELSNCTWYDYLIVNSDLEKAIGELESVITADRCRTDRRLSGIKTIFSI